MLYISKRLMFLIITILITMTINFILPRSMPGDPLEIMINRSQISLSEESVEGLKEAYGIDSDENMFIQYLKYMKRVSTGDFGESILYYPTKVIDIVKRAIPWTIGLVGLSLIISFFLGTFAGILSAWKRNTMLSDLLINGGLFLRALPFFWIALIVIYIFAYKLGWFPISGPYSTQAKPGIEKILSIAYYGFLPLVSNIIISIGGWLLIMRNNMINVVSEDYISFARAKGLLERVIRDRYAARNAILPSFTGIAMSLGIIVGGNVFTEIIFSYPGLGYVLYQSIIGLDYRLMEACFLFITISVILLNFIADIFYIFLDPRIRSGEE